MKPGKIINKTKGPVKTGPTGPSAVGTKKKPTAKQAKMGHAKVAQKAPAVPCSLGHPTQLVHYNRLGNMHQWCPTCRGVV